MRASSSSRMLVTERRRAGRRGRPMAGRRQERAALRDVEALRESRDLAALADRDLVREGAIRCLVLAQWISDRGGVSIHTSFGQTSSSPLCPRRGLALWPCRGTFAP